MKVRRTLMLPKEHGAWAMLFIPFVAGALVAGRLSPSLVFLALSMTAVFIARESLLRWLRSRSRGLHPDKADRYTAGYLIAAALFGAPLFLVYELYWLAPVAVATSMLMVVNAWQAVRREDRTIIGELLAIVGLTLAAPAAHYTASGTLSGDALWLWALCILYFSSSVFYVKLRVSTINPRNDEARRSRWRCAVYHVFLLAALVALSSTGSLNVFAVAAFSPVLIRSFWHLAGPVRKVNLRRVGWQEVVYSMVFLFFTTQAFRF